MLGRLSLLLLPALVLGAAASPAGAAAPRVVRLGRLPARVSAGGRLTAPVATRPAKTMLTLFLSADRRHDRKDLALGRARTAKGSVSVMVPKAVKPGAYHLVVCAGKRCTVSKATMKVTAAVVPPSPSPKQPAGTPPTPSSSSSPSAGAAAGALPGLPSLATAPDPVSVTPAPDATHAASARIGAAGGTLDATGADGSTFHLAVPAGALLGDETITMTPVTGIGGLPLTTAPAAAVQLGPDGLSLLTPAQLTIVPAHPAPTAEQTGFGWHGGGTDFHLEPIGTDPAKVVLDLWHFSGAGVGGGSAAEQAAQQQHLPLTEQDRFSQQVAQILHDARAQDGHATPDQVTAEAVQAYDDLVAPLVAAAATDDAQLDVAVRTALSWASQVERLGADPDADGPLGARLRSATALLAAALDHGYTQARTACQGGDLKQGLRMLQLGAQRARLGAAAGDDPTGDLAKCMRFTLQGDDEVRMTPGNLHSTWHLKDVVLTMDPQGALRATATPQDGAMDPTMIGDCSVTPTSYDPGPAEPVILGFDWNLRTETGPDGVERTVQGAPKLSVTFGFFEPVDNYYGTCPKGPSINGLWRPWDNGWLFASSATMGPDGFVYDGLTAGSGAGGAPIVDKTDDVTAPVGGGEVHHVFHMVIRHTPQA